MSWHAQRLAPARIGHRQLNHPRKPFPQSVASSGMKDTSTHSVLASSRSCYQIVSCPLKKVLDKKVFRPLIWQVVVFNFTLCTGRPANTTQQAEPPDNTLGLPEPAAMSSNFGLKHPPFPGSKFQNGGRDGGTTSGHQSREVTAEAGRPLPPPGSAGPCSLHSSPN